MARLGRGGEVGDAPGRRQEVLCRILGIDARFQRVAGDGELVLRQRQRFAAGHAQLPFHQVQPGDHFGHRVLDLKPRIHFHEIERACAVPVARLGDEFHRAGADVADRPGRGDCGRAHAVAPRLGHARRGRFFQHFLMAPLHRAIALEQVERVALRVGEHLDFDVARAREIFFQQHALVAEARFRFALAGGERAGKIRGFVDDAHALAAAAGRCLDQHRIADLVRLFLQQGRALSIAVIAGHQRHAGAAHDVFGCALAAHGADRGGRRSDKHQARFCAGFGEVRVLGEEAVAGVDAFCAGLPGRFEDLVAAQVAVCGRGRPDAIRLVGQIDVARIRVGFGIHGDRFHAEALRGLDHPAGDFAAVGNEYFLEHEML